MPNSSDVYDKDGSIVARTIDDETILVPIRHDVGDLESIFTLNEVGARIWELVDGVRSAEEIANAISLEFEVDPAEAKKDTWEFCSQLKEIGAIRNVPVKEAG